MRLDDEPRSVDLAQSSGVIGSRRLGQSLFVHLGHHRGELVLTDHPGAHVYLEQANHVVAQVTLEPTRLRLTSQAHSPRVLEFAGFPASALVTIRIDGAARQQVATADGHVLVALPPGGPQTIELSL
jgi:hypothetical protein